VADRGAAYRARIGQLADVAVQILHDSDSLAEVASQVSRRSSGSGARLGAARESALKMLEMTDGQVHQERHGRHGPMRGPRRHLVVCFLSRSDHSRIQIDLIRSWIANSSACIARGRRRAR
jgi:tagatose-6-phosphate ketose/aldose isomerase